MGLLELIPRLRRLVELLFHRSDLDLQLLDLAAIGQGLVGVVAGQLVLQFSERGF
jgi:hypothetical protein